MRQDERVRLAKFLAHAGVASRRTAEELIAAGRVSVDGQVVRDPARDVDERILKRQERILSRLLTAQRSLMARLVRPRRFRQMVAGIRARALIVQGALDRLVPVAEIPELVAAGKIQHSLVVVALYYYELWRRRQD